MLIDEISTKVKRWAIILKVETVSFLAHMGYNIEDTVKCTTIIIIHLNIILYYMRLFSTKWTEV